MKEIVINTKPTNKQVTYSIIKALCHAKQISMAELVRRRNTLHPDEPTTPQNLSNKLSRDTLKVTEFLELLNIMGYDRVICVESPTNKGLVDYAGNPLKRETQPTNDSPVEPQKRLIESQVQKSYAELIAEGYCEVKTINFQSAIVAGKLCEDAAAWIESNLFDGMDETQEVVLYLAASRQFQVKVKPVSSDPTKEYFMI